MQRIRVRGDALIATPNLTFNALNFQAIHTVFLQQIGTKLLRDELDGPHNDKYAS